jgi:hypothetical protein
LAPEISPRALPRELLRIELGVSPYGDPSQLPIPLVKLPPICAVAPWWLVYLGHEVGHQVLHDLKLMSDFNRKIQLAAGISPQALDDGTSNSVWGKWSEEIFADAFSVYMMGADAAWAVSELILDEDLRMLSSKTPNYPPPVVRLALLSGLVNALGLKDLNVQDDVDIDRLLHLHLDNDIQRGNQTKAQQAVDLLHQVVPALAEHQKEPANLLRKLCGWTIQEKGSFPPENAIRNWHNAFVSGKKPLFGPSLSMARLITSAAAQRWREIVSTDQFPDRSAAQEDLKKQFLEAIRTHRDPATRAAKKEALPDLTAVASGISQALRQAKFDEE